MKCQERTSYFYKESWKEILFKYLSSGGSDSLCQHTAGEHCTEHHSEEIVSDITADAPICCQHHQEREGFSLSQGQDWGFETDPPSLCYKLPRKN